MEIVLLRCFEGKHVRYVVAALSKSDAYDHLLFITKVHKVAYDSIKEDKVSIEDAIRWAIKSRRNVDLDQYKYADLYKMLLRISPGVVTYSYLARKLGWHPRKVAWALKCNPLQLIVPCHLVVRADGSLGGYTPGGIELKRRLIELEKLYGSSSFDQ